MNAPFRSPAPMVSASGKCARCGCEAARADLVFEIDGTLRCRACERPLPALPPLPRDAISLELQVALAAGGAALLAFVSWVMSLTH